MSECLRGRLQFAALIFLAVIALAFAIAIAPRCTPDERSLTVSGMLVRGLALAGYSTVAACEIDGWRRAVFAAQHPGCVMYADVRDLTAGHLIRDLGSKP